MRTVYPEFREEFATTRYPFADYAVLTTRGNVGLRIPAGVFLDASIYPLLATVPLFLDSLGIAPREITVRIRDARGTIAATGTFDPMDAPEVVALADSLLRPAGILVADPARLSEFGAWPFGEYVFSSAEFAASCVIPMPTTCVWGVQPRTLELLTGDVWLIGDNGVVFSKSGSHDIRVDIVGDPLALRALCTPLTAFQTPNFIRTINRCPPDANNNFNITVGDAVNPQTVLRVYPQDGKLFIDTVRPAPG